MKRIALLLTAAVLAGGTAVAATTWHTSPAAASTAPTGLDFGLRDSDDGSSLLATLNPSDPRYGQFLVSLTGVGLLWGSAPATTAPSGSSSIVQLRYDGTGYEDAKATLDPTYGVDVHPGGTPTTVTLRIVGQVDTARHVGTLEVWVNGRHHQISGQQPATDPAATTAKYLAAVKAADLPALYALATTDVRRSATLEQFTASLSKGDPFKGITDATATGPAKVTTNASGTRYAAVPIRVSRGTTTQDGSLTLVWDSGEWRVFTVR